MYRPNPLSTRVHDAIQRLKACRVTLAADDLLSGTTTACALDLRLCAAELQMLAHDVATAQQAAAAGHRAALEGRAC